MASSHGCVNVCTLIEGTDEGLTQQALSRAHLGVKAFGLEFRQVPIRKKAICVKAVW